MRLWSNLPPARVARLIALLVSAALAACDLPGNRTGAGAANITITNQNTVCGRGNCTADNNTTSNATVGNTVTQAD